ncbi:hypothetical protein [Streptomyces sp. NPDC001985]|uniref:terpene synthase family protein n=1 Tax=Streptomyces sp. NPDC001985 TaxID=3154406 RepID=UPI00332F0692
MTAGTAGGPPEPEPAGGPPEPEPEHSAWLLRHRLLPEAELERYHTYALPELIRRAYPGAPGGERGLLTDILGWYTVVDDLFDGPLGRDVPGARALVRELTGVTRSPGGRSLGGAGVVGAWCDLWDRQCRGRTALWCRRAAGDWTRTLGTFATETAHRARGGLPSVAESALLRRWAGGLYPFMNMLEHVQGAELPARLRARPAWRRLRAHTADAATLINDLFSLAREEEQNCGFNMVVVLRRERGLTREEALTAVRERVRRLEEESALLRSGLAREFPGSRWYLEGTRQLVAGVRAWTGSTARYRGPKSQLPGVSVASLV